MESRKSTENWTGPRTLSPQHIIAFFGDTNYINKAQIRYVCEINHSPSGATRPRVSRFISYTLINVSEISRTPCRACANIYRFALTGHLYYSWQVLRVVGGRLALLQLCMLLACIYLYCTHQVLAQLLHHFLPYISWIAPARQQCSTFC